MFQFTDEVPLLRIKCAHCEVVKNISAYRDKRLNELKVKKKKQPNFNATTTAYITCSQCSSNQVTELTCFYCDETKELDEFANNQRSKPGEIFPLRAMYSEREILTAG